MTSKPIRLFHVSDVHFGREDAAAIRWFTDMAIAERPDAVILTGDLTMRARASEFAAAGEWVKSLPVPVSIEPGNHDLPYYNPLRRIFRPYHRYHKIERALEREIELPGVWIVPLKTTARFQWRLNWSWGVVSPGSLDRALTRLAACPANHLAIVACHHPLVEGVAQAGHSRTHGGPEALDALAKAGAHAVLSGHVHDPFDVPSAAGPRLIGAGTLSERVRSTPPSFNELRVADGKLDVLLRAMT
jgi:3',5'-cyclic AMP phosphodiesterase CpdA